MAYRGNSTNFIEPLFPNGERFPVDASGVADFFRDRIVHAGHIFIGDTRIEIEPSCNADPWSVYQPVLDVKHVAKKPDGIPLSFLKTLRIFGGAHCKLYRGTLYVELFHANHDNLKKEYLFHPPERTYKMLLTTPELFSNSNYMRVRESTAELTYFGLPITRAWMRMPLDSKEYVDEPLVLTREELNTLNIKREANLLHLRAMYKYEPPTDEDGRGQWNPRKWKTYNAWRESHDGTVLWTPELIPDSFLAFLKKYTVGRVWHSAAFKQTLVPAEWTSSPFAALKDPEIIRGCPYLREFAGIVLDEPELLKRTVLSEI